MTFEIKQETAEKIHNELLKANKLATQGRLDEAKKLCLSVYKLSPDYPDTNQVLGLIYLQENDFSKAAGHFERALEIYPKQPFVWLRLGQTLIRLNQPKEAKKAFETALKHDAKAAEAYFRLGEIESASGNSKEAEKFFAKAAAIDPKWGPKKP